MKLSMWILAERFSAYDIRYDIRDSEAEITGVRFISEELYDLSSEYVYVGKCSDVFSDPDYESTVILVHGHDLMFIENQTAEDILNETLAAFAFYNQWENSLWAAAAESNPVQSMIDACDEVMRGPLAVTHSDGHVIAYTQSEQAHPHNEGWETMIRVGLVPHAYTSSQIRDENGNLLDDWPTHPQILKMEDNTCIGSQIVAEGEIVGAFYLEQYKTTLTQRDVHLAAVFCEVLASLSAAQGAHPEIRTSAAIIGSLLAGEDPAESSLAQLGTLFDRPPPYQLLALRSATSSTNIVRRNTLLETSKSLIKDSLALVYGDDVICLIPTVLTGAFLQSLEAHINPSHYAIGISLPFSNWEQTSSRYKQAQGALESNLNAAGVFHFRDFALNRLLGELQGLNEELDFTHPALAALKAYDEKNATELYLTLQQYLSNERNMVKTAEELCIHRNSMKYRMKRILDLTELALDDPNERLYLLLSFALEDSYSGAS